MSDVNKPYFEHLMSQRGLSMRRLADRMGKKHSQLSLTLDGHRKMPLDEACQWSEIFGQPLYRIAQNMGLSVRGIEPQRVPIVGRVNGFAEIDLDHSEHPIRIETPDELPEGSIAIQMRTANSPLEYMDGWLLFCRVPRPVDPECLGRLCACQIAGGPVVLANLRRGYLPGTFNLAYPYERESAKLEWATPVLKITT